jgi:hypothetical protein
LRIVSPAISRVGNGGWPGLSVDRPRQLHQRVVHVDDLIKP